MASTATRGATVPTTAAAIAPTGHACVTLDSMEGSVTCVSLTVSLFLHLPLLSLVSKDTRSPVCVCVLCPACPKWAYGPGCSEECKCVQQNTLECHRRHGTCVCKPGYQGNTCSEGQWSWLRNLGNHLLDASCQCVSFNLLSCISECEGGYYGAGCKRSCDCPSGVSCDHVTGQCQHQCPAGLRGDNCELGKYCAGYITEIQCRINSIRVKFKTVWVQEC